MKLNSKLQAEILTAYHTMWDANLSGDIKTFASFLDNNVTVYGTAAGEVFTSKKEAIKFYRATADQLAGKADFRKRKINIQVIGNTVVIYEQCDLYVLEEINWMFYGHARITAIFEQKKNSWKIVHMHGSFPDSRTGEGEQLNTNKIKAENIQLRDAIRRRTEELEQKNRELEIETALEKVRAVAMGMKKPEDMLTICKTISKQLASLGIKEIRNVQTAIFYAQRGTYMNYQYYAKHNKTFITDTVYTDHKVSRDFAAQMLKGKGKFYITHITGRKKLKDWIAYQKSTHVFIDKYLHTAPSLSYYWYSLGPVALGISTYFPLTEEEENLFKRFLNVFELSYRRYLDIEKAAAQAREAQIELALERVRARGMAMQTSEELGALIGTLFTELTKLDLVLTRCVTWIIDPKTNDAVWWMANSEDPTHPMNYFIPNHQQPPWLAFMKEWKKRTIKWVYDLKGKTKKNWDDHLFSKTGLAKMPKFIQNGMRAPERILLSASFNNFGGINVASLEPLSEEHFTILLRFAKVFDQTYTRFLDLQNAEKQAREAEIELALERVRAKTMAMQKSEELKETTLVLFQQFKALGATTAQVSICIFDEEMKMGEMFVTLKGEKIDRSFPMELDKEVFVMKKAKKAFLEKQKTFSLTIRRKELQAYNHWRNVLIGKKGWDESAASRKQSWYVNAVFFSRGMMGISSDTAPAAETLKLLERFATVFDLTFTRFLDLQKAEAQAREAQIEAALERVRSRSMAMHKSEELRDVIKVVLDQFIHLNINAAHAGFYIDYKAHDDMHIWLADPNIEPFFAVIPYFDTPTWNSFLEAKAKGTILHTDLLDFKTKNKFYKKLFKLFSIPEDAQQFYLQCKGLAVSTVLLDSVGLYIENFEGIPYTDEENAVLIRMGKVFQQTYTRFLDLQKAEAQAREAQIELALERVRARTMAMQKSDELADAAKLLYQEFGTLGIKTLSCGYMFIDEEKNKQTAWVVLLDGTLLPDFIEFPLTGDHVLDSRYKDWKEKKPLHTYEIQGEVNKEHHRFLSSFVPPFVVEEIFSKLPDRIVFHCANFSDGYLLILATEYLLQEEQQTIIRFAKVFEMTYTRFLDLKKAEAQARESQIQLALERVRARTMAMQRSDELSEAVFILFNQFKELGDKPDQATIGIINEKEWVIEYWVTMYGHQMDKVFKFSIDEPHVTNRIYKAWKEEKKSLVIDLSGKELFEFTHYRERMGGAKHNPDEKRRIFNIAFFSKGLLIVQSNETRSEESIGLLERFAAVFEQTYTRFLDLKKAEEQAREAQIEAGLERLRARTMAMHNSEDVSAATATMFTELERLGIENLRCGITIIHKNKIQEVWSVSNVMDNLDGDAIEKKKVLAAGIFDMNAHPLWQLIYDKWDNKEDFMQYDLAGKDKEDYFKILNTKKGYLPQAIQQFPDTNFEVYFFGEGGVWSCSIQPHTEEQKQIMKRFSSVFSLTFRRYQDLKKAEANAREAKIEAAMEKVRARALAMQKADELTEVAQVLRKEMGLLGVEELETSSIYIHNETTGKTECWYAIKDDKKLVADHMTIDLNDTWVGRQMYEFYRSDKKQISIRMQGANRKEWINYCSEKSKALSGFYGDDIPDRTYHLYKFSNGYMGAASPGDISAESWELLQRATAVFSLAYTRFSDLQQAEAATKEAVKQAALDRIRADIASMRTVNDLNRITPLIWNELTILGIPFIRCGVFIMDNDQQLIHTFLSTPEGKAIAAFHILYNIPGNVSRILAHWQKKEKYLDHWDEEAFTDFAHTMVKQGALASPEQYLKTLPKGGFYLHFLPFLQGMLYVGNTTQLCEEEISLLQSVADAFSTAYARYEDFNKLEAAKKQVDSTLTELKATQNQLIQSEKMASLGELTAGIAHEIQNPLNFVNNFSEVSNELIEELKIKNEKLKIEDEEVKELLNDIAQNLEKINHHGKRADAIVKSMLQHSRSSSGKKEWVDINALADEYLRLSFHGLRAKDKSFNAKFETHLDPSIEKISVVPQDMGRVILNLINNAFYAVSERKKKNEPGYEPTVTITTKKENGRIEVKVRDNGTGIPPKVLEKIFQPFFTTKPTGQGTGLGLSLSYDIIKAHSGELKVETKEGEGSEFIIQLPNVSN
jgi:signal transduction histidine kinase/ketosteroid isomerase-like protein